MTEKYLVINGARHHNLKNISLAIPKEKLVVITGLSGSGKSTLAFDTIYAEGQRRYVESLSAYARQFLEMMDKPEVDSIEGLSPAISIQQKTTSKNPRSTVGTITEIYDYLRLLYARVGEPHCPRCDRKISSQSIDTITDTILGDFNGQKILVLAPLVRGKKGTYEKTVEDIKKSGFSRIRIDDEIFHVEDDEMPSLSKQKKHNIEVVVDRLRAKREEKSRLHESVQAALKTSKGTVLIHTEEEKNNSERIFSQTNSCPYCGISIGELEPRTFSFNSPFGACQQCNGLGVRLEFDPDLLIPDQSKSVMDGAIIPWNGRFSSFRRQSLRDVGRRYGFTLNTPFYKLSPKQKRVILYGTDEIMRFSFKSKSSDSRWEYTDSFSGVIPSLNRQFFETESESKREALKKFMREFACSKCKGKRLQDEALAVKINNSSIMDVCGLSIDSCYSFLNNLQLSSTKAFIAKGILKEILSRLEFLLNVGLNYLTLNRSSGTLSGGESQRIRLATQIGSNLTGVLYVLDEPTIGLHQRDNARLINTLVKLRDLSNTVLVVEHDEGVIKNSDWVIDLGPGAGVHGGQIVFEGTVDKIMYDQNSTTGQYLSHKKEIKLLEKSRKSKGKLTIRGAKHNNLKNIDVEIPLGMMVAVTGVSGSGKSTLVNDILFTGLSERFYGSNEKPGLHDNIEGIGNIDKVIGIDQSPIGRTPRSNPATYIGAFTPIRELFAKTELSKERGYLPGQFSFNVADGRCEACEGDGVKRIEMQFLSDVYVICDECKGKRYNSETLSVLYKGKSIADVLGLTVEEALEFFQNIPQIKRRLQTINDVGLGYIKLGQSATTLSGGEAQRVKLAAELSKRDTGRTLYILDEPTTGLHFADVQKLMDVLNRLVNMGNTVVIIEHNLDVIKNTDWIVDLGPEGGDGGGTVVAKGTPQEVAQDSKSYTGQYLRNIFMTEKIAIK